MPVYDGMQATVAPSGALAIIYPSGNGGIGLVRGHL